MNIYFCGIGGVGIGPLAEIARDAGHTVQGSDTKQSLTTKELSERDVTVTTDQSGAFLTAAHADNPIDWFVYTAALPADHPELLTAQQLGIHTAKRDELLNHIISEKNLKLIAIAGTHGKTTTTAMMVWTMRQLGIPVSYSIGSTVSFGPSGYFDPASKYFVYECDEFDRNFLHFSPFVTAITSIDYDHPDTYPTPASYTDAFTQLINQSQHTIMWKHDTTTGTTPHDDSWVLQDSEAIDYKIPGAHNRANATLIAKVCEYVNFGTSDSVKTALESFPGTSRRFERLAENLYSDYGHHPVEIAATLQMAREINDRVVLVYQPHQNRRQHEIRDQYTNCTELAEDIYWLPTYLSRESVDLPVLTPEELIEGLANSENVHVAELDDILWSAIQVAREHGKLVLCMGAGSIDDWVRQKLADSTQ